MTATHRLEKSDVAKPIGGNKNMRCVLLLSRVESTLEQLCQGVLVASLSLLASAYVRSLDLHNPSQSIKTSPSGRVLTLVS